MEIYFFPYFVLGILHVTNAGFISGNNCGTLTKITKIWQMPTLQEEIDKLNCVIVQHEESFRGYQRKRMENTGCKCCNFGVPHNVISSVDRLARSWPLVDVFSHLR